MIGAHLGAWVALAALLPAMAAAADAVPRCETSAAGREKLDVVCPLAATAQRHRFSAHFSGSHDDTRLSMSVTLDGAPLVCEPGSQTSLEAEDGDVSLHCIVPAAARGMLRVRLSWWHAQYTHFELRPD